MLVTSIKAETEGDRSIEIGEKSILVAVSSMIIQNYNGLSELAVNSASENQKLAQGRTDCWICDIWNVVVSVVVTVVVTAIVVAAIASGIGAALGVIITASFLSTSLWVGAIIGGSWALYDAFVNDICYYAGQCDSEFAGTQSCSTGVCI